MAMSVLTGVGMLCYAVNLYLLPGRQLQGAHLGSDRLNLRKKIRNNRRQRRRGML